MSDMPYTVTVVEEQYGMDDAGKLQLFKVAHFVTALGDSGAVRVPARSFSADVVDALIRADVAEMAKLHGMP